MKPKCPTKQCSSNENSKNRNPETRLILRNGSFYRKSDSRWINRFYCRSCETYFSSATGNDTYYQKKRRVNAPLLELLCSGVSQRRAAILLGVNRKTVVRRMKFLAARARLEQGKFLKTFTENPLESVQFDDLETSEHSKCKPLSVVLAVEPKHRKILGFEVSQMPAKGLLAHTARRKYGPRPDERGVGWEKILSDLEPIVKKDACWTSDENPHYPRYLKQNFPHANHIQVKGRRGCIAGQGELKKIGYDPLFSLNHTCAMLRANLNRLFRRTWCTTKKRESLTDHLAIYVNYHNQRLTPRYAI